LRTREHGLPSDRPLNRLDETIKSSPGETCPFSFPANSRGRHPSQPEMTPSALPACTSFFGILIGSACLLHHPKIRNADFLLERLPQITAAKQRLRRGFLFPFHSFALPHYRPYQNHCQPFCVVNTGTKRLLACKCRAIGYFRAGYTHVTSHQPVESHFDHG
jgi:hypothetical protein